MTAKPEPNPPRWRGWLVAAGVAVTAWLLYRHFDLGRVLNLHTLQASRDALVSAYQARPLAVLAAYFALYVGATALSIPGAAVLTLAAGAMFGFWVGLLVVSFASSLGALLAFLAARYLLRDALQRRFGQALAPINDGVARDGAFYLLSLRLVPLFPFWLVNLLSGLTPIAAGRYYAVSQLGMLPGTAVYVNAGTQLAGLKSTADVLSPALLGSLVLLGLFPLLAKALVDAWRRRRLYAAWPRPKHFDRNLVVIGAGSGGLVSAYIAAAVQAKVTLVEAAEMGGDCLNTGCVPSKALIRSAKAAKDLQRAAALGLRDVHGEVDFAAVMARVQRVVEQIAPHDSVARYTELGVDVVQGHARLVTPWQVEISRADGSRQTLTTRAVVIATGARPTVPPLPGLDALGCLTSETLWQLRTLPRRLVVLGGGPIGCELAQAFARLGAQVTQIEMAPRVLLREDAEASDSVAAALRADGVDLRTGCRALRCERDGDARRIVVAQDGAEQAIAFDALLCAVGRSARVTGFGLEELGITLTERGTVATNAWLQTRLPNIFAVGDVAGPYQLTHAASHQAWYAAVNALFGSIKRFKADYAVLPWTTFTDPEVARVGLSEAEARAQGIAHEVTRYDLADLDRAIADDCAHGFVKLLTAPGSDKLLGATIVGAHAGELLAECVLAMRHGIGLNKLLGTVHAYPTLAEANKFAAGAWKRAHAPKRLLAWARRYHDWRRQ